VTPSACHEPGVVIVFELDSIEQAKRYMADFPMSKAGYLEWFYIPLQAPLPVESPMDKSVDTGLPYDRTANTK
jgi:hypothetical protein